jgi:hypothetical protein
LVLFFKKERDFVFDGKTRQSTDVSGSFRMRVLTARLIAWAAFAVLGLFPLVFVRVPGLGDYLNHLARMHVLTSDAPELHQYYEVHWTPIPYLAMDMVTPLLVRVLPIYVAGKLFVLACVLSPVAGAAALHYAVYRRLSLVPLGAWLVAYNFLLALGFLNYLFSVGCALALFAGWIAAAGWPRWRRAVIFAPFVLLLYFGHAFACADYCLAVTGFELHRMFGCRPFRLRAATLDAVAALAQALPAMLFAVTLNVNAGYVGRLHTQWGDLGAKLLAIASPIVVFHDRVDLWVSLAALALAVVLAARVRIAPQVWPSCLPIAAGAIAMPHVLFSTWGMDLRLPLFLVLLLIAGASFPRAPAWRWPAVFAVALLVGVKSADCYSVLRGLDADIAETRTILSQLPTGARLLVVNVAGRGTGTERVPQSTIWHMPLTAVIDHDAFVPYFFNGLTTVRMRAAYLPFSTPNGLPVSMAELRDGARHAVATGPDQIDPENPGGRIYWFDWPRHYDFVLIQRFGASPGPLPPGLSLAAHSPNMDLYRVQ